MKLLKDLYRIWSPSLKESKMQDFITKFCKKIPDTIVEKDAIGNLYVKKGESDTYPCIVAHMDQVQKIHPKDFVAIETRDIILGYSPSTRTQCGLGADDKNGIWIALKCLQKYSAIKLAFFVGEETGCIGSDKANLDFFRDCRFLIQCDRRGKDDLIYSIGGVELCSEEFLNAINFEQFGYHKENGLSTDVAALKENELGVSCINLSCGYYEPHTDNEITVKSDLFKCLRFVQNIVESCTEVYDHQWCDAYYNYPYYCRGGSSIISNNSSKQLELDELYSELWDLLDMNTYNYSVEDIKTWYKGVYPHLDDSDLERVFNEVRDEVISYRTCRWNQGVI